MQGDENGKRKDTKGSRKSINPIKTFLIGKVFDTIMCRLSRFRFRTSFKFLTSFQIVFKYIDFLFFRWDRMNFPSQHMYVCRYIRRSRGPNSFKSQIPNSLGIFAFKVSVNISGWISSVS